VRITRLFLRLKILGLMRHKVLIVFFLLGSFQLLPVAQVVTHRNIPVLSDDSILSDDSHKRLVQLNKLFQSVPQDTSATKVGSFDPNFREKYQNDNEFNYNREEGGKSFFKRLFEKIGRLLERMFAIAPGYKNKDLTVLVFKILCGLVVLVVMYFAIRMLMNHNGRWFFSKKNESIVIDHNNTEQLIQFAGFEQLISETEKKGDTRQSIRLYYLWLLKDLKDRELIIWMPEKTNADYLSELREETLRKKFTYLSYLYNCIWYGEFSIGDQDYITARKAFLNHLKGDRQHG